MLRTLTVLFISFSFVSACISQTSWVIAKLEAAGVEVTNCETDINHHNTIDCTAELNDEWYTLTIAGGHESAAIIVNSSLRESLDTVEGLVALSIAQKRGPVLFHLKADSEADVSTATILKQFAFANTPMDAKELEARITGAKIRNAMVAITKAYAIKHNGTTAPNAFTTVQTPGD